jgi:hypothetical protein
VLTLFSNLDTKLFKMKVVPFKGACALERHLLKKLVDSRRKTESFHMADRMNVT